MPGKCLGEGITTLYITDNLLQRFFEDRVFCLLGQNI